MKTITNIIDKKKPSKRGRINLSGKLEDGQQVDLQVSAKQLMLCDLNEKGYALNWSKQNKYELTPGAIATLKDIYSVRNV